MTTNWKKEVGDVMFGRFSMDEKASEVLALIQRARAEERAATIEECAAYVDRFNPPAVGSWLRSLKKVKP